MQLSGEYETVQQHLVEATQKQQGVESEQMTKLKKQVADEQKKANSMHTRHTKEATKLNSTIKELEGTIAALQKAQQSMEMKHKTASKVSKAHAKEQRLLFEKEMLENAEQFHMLLSRVTEYGPACPPCSVPFRLPLGGGGGEASWASAPHPYVCLTPMLSTCSFALPGGPGAGRGTNANSPIGNLLILCLNPACRDCFGGSDLRLESQLQEPSEKKERQSSGMSADEARLKLLQEANKKEKKKLDRTRTGTARGSARA